MPSALKTNVLTCNVLIEKQKHRGHKCRQKRSPSSPNRQIKQRNQPRSSSSRPKLSWNGQGGQSYAMRETRRTCHPCGCDNSNGGCEIGNRIANGFREIGSFTQALQARRKRTRGRGADQSQECLHQGRGRKVSCYIRKCFE